MMRYAKLLAQVSVGFVILLWLLQLAEVSKVYSILLSSNLLMLALSAIFFIIASFFVALAFYVSLKSLSSNIPIGRAIMASFAGQLLSDVTPVRSGYFATPLILNKLCGTAMEKGVVGVVVTGVINSFVKIMLAIIGVTYFMKFLPLPSTLFNALIVGIVFLLIGGLILLAILLEKRALGFSAVFEKIPILRSFRQKLFEMFSKIQGEWQKAKKNLHYVALLLLLSVIANAIALYLIFSALCPSSPNLVDFVFMAALAGCVMYIPVTVAGLGVQETIYVLLLTLLGVRFEIAVTFALLTRALFTGTDIIGLPPLIKAGFKTEK